MQSACGICIPTCVAFAACLANRVRSQSGLGRPDRTPTVRVYALTWENLTGEPRFAIVTLSQSTVCAGLRVGRICTRRRIDRRGVMRVLHCLRHRVVFCKLWQIARVSRPTWVYDTTRRGRGGKLNEFASCYFFHGILLGCRYWRGMLSKPQACTHSGKCVCAHGHRRQPLTLYLLRNATLMYEISASISSSRSTSRRH